MKRIVLLMAFILSGHQFLFSQTNNVIVFTENGEKFQLVLNGILQNSTPETNVKMTGLPAPNYKCRAIFADTKLGYLDFSVYFQEAGEELTMSIKQNKKGEYVTRYVSSIPIATAPPSPPTQKVYVYSMTAPATSTVSTSVTQTTTTHSTGAKPAGDNVNLQMGVNMNENGGSISINASGLDADESNITSTTTTTTTTTHTVSSSVSSNTTETQPHEVVYVPGYSGKTGCPHPMDPADFAAMKQSISSKDFESTRLTIAKQSLQQNCLLASQVQEMLSLFDFENTKLEFAKYAYDHTYDTGNYFKVNDAFEFESSVEDLNKYIGSKN